MAHISGTLYVGAVMDGVMIHASLVSSRSLAQVYDSNSGNVTPDWTQTANQPTITLRLAKGATTVSPSSGGWYWNGIELTFDSSTNLSTNETCVGKFRKGTDTAGRQTLTIVGNLAQSGADRDVISYEGTVEDSGVQIEFSAQAEIRLTEASGNTFVGTLYTTNGETEFSEQSQNIAVSARLYNAGTEVSCITAASQWSTARNKYRCVWQVNGVTQSSNLNSITVNEDDVVDWAVILCTFQYKDSEGTVSDVFTERLELDDVTDPEFLWVTKRTYTSAGTEIGDNSAGQGSTATLRSGQYVDFDIFVGTISDPTADTAWDTYKVSVLNQKNETINPTRISSLSGKTVTDNQVDITSSTAGHGELRVTYSDVTGIGSGLNFILQVSKSS